MMSKWETWFLKKRVRKTGQWEELMGKRWLTGITGIRVSNTWEGFDERRRDECSIQEKASRWMPRGEQRGCFNLFLTYVSVFLLWISFIFQLNCMFPHTWDFILIIKKNKRLNRPFCCRVTSLLARLDSTFYWKKKKKKTNVAGFYRENTHQLYRKSQIFSENRQRHCRLWSHH